MNIVYEIGNIPSNGFCPWVCRIYIKNNCKSPNLWFSYKTRKIAREKLKTYKKSFNVDWFKKAMK